MLIDGKQMHIQIKKGDIGRYVILPGDPARCEKIARYFDEPQQLAHNREYTLWTGKLGDVPVAVCSTGIAARPPRSRWRSWSSAAQIRLSVSAHRAASWTR